MQARPELCSHLSWIMVTITQGIHRDCITSRIERWRQPVCFEMRWIMMGIDLFPENEKRQLCIPKQIDFLHLLILHQQVKGYQLTIKLGTKMWKLGFRKLNISWFYPGHFHLNQQHFFTFILPLNQTIWPWPICTCESLL